MAQAYETRHRRNGAIDLRDDMATLQKDLSHLTDDIGSIFTQKWNAAGERVNGGSSQLLRKCVLVLLQLSAQRPVQASWRVF